MPNRELELIFFFHTPFSPTTHLPLFSNVSVNALRNYTLFARSPANFVRIYWLISLVAVERRNGPPSQMAASKGRP